MNKDDPKIISLVKLLENILKMKGGRGYSAGSIVPLHQPHQPLGKSKYEYIPTKDQESLGPVAVSRAYKKGDKHEM